MVRSSSSAGFTPDLSKAGEKKSEGEGATFVWFSPVDAPDSRFRYALIKEEGGVLSIQPGEGRFKKGLPALRHEGEKGGEGVKWMVVKTRPNRIDLKKAD